METTSHTRTSPLPLNDELLPKKNTTPGMAFFDRVRSNPALAIQLGVGTLLVAAVVAAAVGLWMSRSSAANDALSAAMQTYDTPVNTPDQPVPAGTKSFNSVEDRAKAANAEFAAVANKYGMMDAGRNALYLEGVTAVQMGQSATGEALLKKSADSWNHDVATLAELALAGLYRSTGREQLAIDTLQQVAKKPSTLVPAGLAQIQLAELYDANGKSADAKKIYAQIKDKDPKSAAAELATQKLAGPGNPQ